jgi:NADPH-dependent stearoyl-CoA 9-desaturase
MAITDVPAFAHLTDADIEGLAFELDAIRQQVEDSLGERDARYIRRTVAVQRVLDVAGRLLLAGSSKRSAWWAGTVTLGLAKIIENMEIGHNVMHGQWNWMNDPEIHSTTWEWDMSAASKHWRSAHNFQHHKYTNILGMDDDVGYFILRVTRDQPWERYNIGNLLFNALLALGFEWGIGLQTVDFEKLLKAGPDRDITLQQTREFSTKAGRQVAKDYVAFPALTSLSPAATYKSTLKANVVANVIRNIWANAVIFCGHFPDGAEKFTKTDMIGETKGQWYLRQMLGSANFEAGAGAAVHERQPVPPDRASPVSRSAEQPVARDFGAGASGVRQVRLALHNRLFPDAVRQDVAHHRQTVVAEQIPTRHR